MVIVAKVYQAFLVVIVIPESTALRKFAVILGIGPDARERVRLADFLTSMQHHEPAACAYFVLVNDGHDPTALRAVLAPFSARVIILDNPRRGRGWGWAGGLTTGMLTALRWIARYGDQTDFVLKADTDTFILKPFADKVQEMFAADTGIGALGHYYNPNERGVGLHSDWRRHLRRLRMPFSLWRRPHWHVRCSLWGRGRRIRHLLEHSLARGYALGEFCSGGGYALSKVALKNLQQQGWFDDVELFLEHSVTEDVIVGMLVRSTGLKLAEGGRSIFGTHASFFDSAQALLDEDCCILHPVKSGNQGEEDAVREQLRRRAFQAAE